MNYERYDVAGNLISFITLPDPPVTNEDINKEREKRIEAGFTITVSAGKDVPVDTDEKGQRTLQGMASIALARLAVNDTTSTLFRGSDNQTYTLSPQEMLTLSLGVAEEVDKIYKKSWTLKAYNPIPQNYTNEMYWS